MADKYVVSKATLDDIGAAIGEQQGVTVQYTPKEMPAAIRSIQKGAVIDDTTPALDKVYSSQKIQDDFINKTTKSQQVLQSNFKAQYVEGTWLKTTAVYANNGLSRVAMVDGAGWIYYMDKSQLVQDVIAAIPAAEGVSV